MMRSKRFQRKFVLLSTFTLGAAFAFGLGGCITDLLFVVAPFLL